MQLLKNLIRRIKEEIKSPFFPCDLEDIDFEL